MRRRVPSRIWALQVNTVAASPFVTQETRGRIYRRAGMDLHTEDIRAGCWFFSPDISIGPGTMVNAGCYFENREPITIGARCSLAMEVMVTTSTHEIGPSSQRAAAYVGKPVCIEDGCWLGARCLVLPGVTVGRGCIVAAGAVVAADCAPGGLYAGVPARRVRDL